MTANQLGKTIIEGSIGGQAPLSPYAVGRSKVDRASKWWHWSGKRQQQQVGLYVSVDGQTSTERRATLQADRKFNNGVYCFIVRYVKE